MNLYHPDYVAALRGERERQLKQMMLVKEARRAREAQDARTERPQTRTRWSGFFVRNRPSPAK
ncbi:MAG: hypothetical protein ACRDWA_12305 [Acidimicrobiia bacterium]